MQKRKSKSRRRFESLESKQLLAANLVADINSFSTNSTNPRDIIAVGETACFIAEDENGAELWKSDSSGTQMVKDIVPGAEGSHPYSLTAGESVLFFEAQGGTWRSDGTSDGTFLLADAELKAVSGNYALLVEDRTVLMTNADASVTTEIDFGDSTPDITVGGATLDHFTIRRGSVLSRIDFDRNVVSWDLDLRPGTEIYETANGVITFVNGSTRIYRYSDDVGPPVDLELTFPGNFLGEPPLGQSGDLTFFRSFSNEGTLSLIRTDGTAEGTFSLGEFVDPTNTLGASEFSSAVDGIGGMWSTARLPDELGAELWFTDGTVEGTRQVKDIAPGSEIGSTPRSLTFHDDRLWFIADNGTDGQQVWTSDGTADGTIAVTSFEDTTFDPQILGATDQNVVFSVGTAELGVELWTAGSTTNSAELVRDINPSFADSLPGFLTPMGDNQFVFAANDTSGRHVWQTDLTSDGTSIVLDGSVGSETNDSAPRDLVQFRGQTFFTASDGLHGRELWTMDALGTPQLFKDIELGRAGSHPSELTVAGDTLYFVAHDSSHGIELWQSDGTPEGTQLVADAVPGPAGLAPQQLVVANDELYFLGEHTPEEFFGSPDLSVWKLDGENVVLVHSERSTSFTDLVSLNDQIFFHDNLSRSPVPRTINESGEVVVLPGSDELLTRGRAEPMGVVGNYLVSVDQVGVWYSEGAEGPTRLDSFRNLSGLLFTDEYVIGQAFTGQSFVGNPASGQSAIVGQAITDIVTLEDSNLIFTDDAIFVGDPLALPDQSLMSFDRVLPGAVAFDGGVYFGVGSDNGLADVWFSDGTADGTTQITDVGFSTDRTSFTIHLVDSNLYVSADDGTHGNELWQITLGDRSGDLNGDGVQNAADIDALFAAIRDQNQQPEFDVNGDSEVNSLDTDYLLIEVLDRRWGDTNLDGRIAFDDFLTLSQSFGTINASWSDGDFTGDGEVSFADFLLLSSAFGESTD